MSPEKNMQETYSQMFSKAKNKTKLYRYKKLKTGYYFFGFSLIIFFKGVASTRQTGVNLTYEIN